MEEKKEINAKIRITEVEGQPCLALYALKSIMTGQEILYDYGIRPLPWEMKTKTKSVELGLYSTLSSPSSSSMLPVVPATEPAQPTLEQAESSVQGSSNFMQDSMVVTD